MAPLDVAQQNTNPNCISDTLFKIRMKLMARKMINSTQARMLKNLQPLHYNLIYDKSGLALASVQNGAQGNAHKKKMNLEYSSYQGTSQHHFFVKRALAKLLLKIFYNNVCCKKLISALDKVPVISPTSSFKLAWDIFNVITIITVLFYLPIQLNYDIKF